MMEVVAQYQETHRQDASEDQEMEVRMNESYIK
jgi:hypothetical protein